MAESVSGAAAAVADRPGDGALRGRYREPGYMPSAYPVFWGSGAPALLGPLLRASGRARSAGRVLSGAPPLMQSASHMNLRRKISVSENSRLESSEVLLTLKQS